MKIYYKLVLNLGDKLKKKKNSLRKQSIALIFETEPTVFSPHLTNPDFHVFDVFSSFLEVVPEAGDLLRREVPGLLDPECLMPDDRE